MISLNIVNVYTNIPIRESINLIENELKNTNNISDEYSFELNKILQNILNQNYFKFDGRYHIQKLGVPMGCPLSAKISEIFMQRFDEKIVISYKFSKFW